MNRARGDARRKLEWLFLYVGGLILTLQYTITLEYTDRVDMHSANFYRVCALAFAPVLAAVARGSGRSFGGTSAASGHFILVLALLWILPLVPAQPKLGPVYRPVTHLVPAGFPLLLVVPALAMDWALARFSAWSAWSLALLGGALFLATLVLAQWPFADFLNSPRAWNAFFGSGELDYFTGPQSYDARNAYYPWEKTRAGFWEGMGLALAAAILAVRLGLASGSWMRRIHR